MDDGLAFAMAIQGAFIVLAADIEFVSKHLDESRRVLDEACTSAEFMSAVISISATISSAMRAGHRLFIAGNGGSASDAQHIAGEFLSRLNYDRAPLPAIALTTDSSVMTAIGNDYGYEHLFERQILGLARSNDVFIGISTSGRSPNVLRALAAGHELGMTTIGFTGRSAPAMSEHCNLMLCAPSNSTPQIQQIHIVAAHAICGLVESSLFPRDL
ncbi:D-sedoheptulose 7-phosphate isomerase [Bradyrhizobium sp. Ash2021]|nr:D-sedoheptulose 7-phosphate isomerase [Bradyrhizobium sp. Ash2021]WMT72955.1 D-sedoheptulose 7-phosphate isomerase [Bradyrhizobium sp. Ash2021]